MFKASSLQPILDCFQQKDTRGVTELSIVLGKDKTLLHKYLKELVSRSQLEKIGTGAHVKYHQKRGKNTTASNIDEIVSSLPTYRFSYQQVKALGEHFLKFAPNGKRLAGLKGFVARCDERGLDVEKKAASFLSIADHIEKIKNSCGLIDVSSDFRSHIEGSAIDHLFFVDQYKWMDFGRGKIAELSFYAKDTQDRTLLHEAIALAQEQIECLVRSSHFDAIAITPHSRKRSIQLLKELQRIINFGGLPMIQLEKYAPYGTIIPQKSLRTRQQRIQNARETILLGNSSEAGKYKHVLLIDDFVGSGATLNETAKKLKAAGVKKVTGLALVGNANLSYEVIQEI